MIGGRCAPAKEVLIIFHAGSLAVPFQELEREFEREHPQVDVRREASGSVIAVRKITELGRRADVLAVADYSLIPQLMFPEYADWYICFAGNSMVIAYTESSRYADEINSSNWYEILLREDVAYGHSDPRTDPCGYRTLLVWKLAEEYYGKPGLYRKLVERCPKEHIRPKSVELISLLESGDLDYAFEYRSVALQYELEFVELPDEINLSSPKFADFYRRAKIEIPKTKMIVEGSPIIYGVTVPENAPNPKLAAEFLKLLLSERGREIFRKAGHPPLVPPRASDISKIPKDLIPYLSGRTSEGQRRPPSRILRREPRSLPRGAPRHPEHEECPCIS